MRIEQLRTGPIWLGERTRPERDLGTRMNARTGIRSVMRGFGFGIAVAAASYLMSAGAVWVRYGRARRSDSEPDRDALLDRFMAPCDVVERHETRIAAPSSIIFSAACDLDLWSSAVIRCIFKTRELLLGGVPAGTTLGRGLVAQTTALGWRVLAEVPGQEIVIGAVTQPWMANPVFHSVPPDEFASFHEPGYVKIVWNPRADTLGASDSLFRTETRAVATDAAARARFRLYWAFASPGIRLIRLFALETLRREAECRFRGAKLERKQCTSW
jgi:hypothetical protein